MGNQRTRLACGLGIIAMLAHHAAKAECLGYQLKFQQNADRYTWSITWDSKKSYSQQANQFSVNAGEALEGRSEVIQAMRWNFTSRQQGDLKTWALVDIGIGKSKKYFVRHCQLADSLNCQLDTSIGDGGSQINNMSSQLSCTPSANSQRCTYQESGSVKGVFIIASPQKMSVNINSQSIKDVLRLAIASEFGNSAISRGFNSSRPALDAWWNASQQKLSQGMDSFSVLTTQSCR